MALYSTRRTPGWAIGLAALHSAAFALPSAFAAIPARSAVPPRPQLVVLLVIDQFRADSLLRFDRRFLPAQGAKGEIGGFQYLMSKGAYFPMAEYGLLQSMTCPGHATLLTGAYPYQSGIPTNFWHDTATHQGVYCAEDVDHQIVSVPSHDHPGTSPRNLIGTTVGDELKNAGFASRVVTVALKDRAAIMMGGHRADLAFWMDGKARAWVSSDFYLPQKKLPSWMNELNEGLQQGMSGKYAWKAEGPGSGFSDPAYRPATDTAHIGKSFPHEVPIASKSVLALPYGLDVTEAAAERAVDEYRLGRGAATDLFAMSFSSHDYIGHAFGPNSREIEEMTVHEDRVISRFLNHLRKTLPGGLANVVVVLTGDHGSPSDPDWARAHGMDAGKIKETDVTAALEKRLDDKFGSPGGEKWIAYNHDFNFFVNRQAVAARKTELAAVLQEIKAHLLTIHGVAHVVTLPEYERHVLPPGLHGEQLVHSYFPGRSGDVVIVPRPGFMIEDADSVTHLTGYSYDRMVPLILAGPRIRPGNYAQHARVIDLAPTLSYLLGILPPSLSEGRVLAEALEAGPTSGPRAGGGPH